MAFPGPPLPVWGIALVALAAAVAILGELVRGQLARRVRLLQVDDPLERALLDLYLGGAVFYVVAALPIGAFYPATVAAGLVLGAVGLLAVHLRRGDRAVLRERLEHLVRPLGTPVYLVTVAAVVGLFAVELSATAGVGSGNTYDSSLLATYTGLLLAHHSIPLTLAPVASSGLAYPQGTTVWLAIAQGLFALPPLRTSLLVTPLFLALVPVGAFAVGRRLGGSTTYGAALALVFAVLAGWTRGMVGGSNDFVFALPLVLLLSAWSAEWASEPLLPVSSALAFGGIAGYAAALNPVGPVWLLLSLPVIAVLARPRFGGRLGRWAMRWLAAAAASLVAVIPSLYEIATSPGSVGLGSAAGPASPSGESLAQFISDVDPFLFRPQDQALSPFPLLRAELAILLVVGVALFAFFRERFALGAPLGRFALGGGVVAFVLLAMGLAAGQGSAPFTEFFRVTSPAELSVLLFSLYTIVAAVPLAVAIGALRSLPDLRDLRAARPRADRGPIPALLSVVAIGLILVPGIGVTATQLPGQLHEGYTDFSNLTAADVDLLAWIQNHVPDGSRVLVAPGSVAEFLPAYKPTLVVLYPMTVGFSIDHPTYWSVIEALQNGTADSTVWKAVLSLELNYAAVTEDNTDLYAPLQPGPFLAWNQTAVFHEGGVFLFRLPGPPMAFGSSA